MEERRQYDADITAGRPPQRSLVPLQVIDVFDNRPTDGRLINDIGYGFGETLKLNFQSYKAFDDVGSVVSLDMDECSIGSSPSWPHCWHAPRLTNLFIYTDHNFLRIHSSLLAQCPQLEDVTLVDRRHEYSASENFRWEPAELCQLETLKLQGSPALSFNLETLNTTRKLKTMEVMMFARPEPSYIPPVAELDDPENDPVGLPPSAAAATLSPCLPTQPIWTWYWDLPKLTRLTLTGEIAHSFQFKMLQGTPSLVQLCVDFSSTTVLHQRTLGVKEFLQKTQDMETTGGALDDDGNKSNNNDNNDNTRRDMQSKHIHLPALQGLTLGESWVLDTEVLECLCKMAPGVITLSLHGCCGFRLADWVGTTSRHLMSIRNATATISIATELVSETGLVEMGVHGENPAWYQLGQRPAGRTTADKINYYFFPY